MIKYVLKTIIKKAVKKAIKEASEELLELSHNLQELSIIIDFKIFTSVFGGAFALHWVDLKKEKEIALRLACQRWRTKDILNSQQLCEFIEDVSPDILEIRISMIRAVRKVDSRSITHLIQKLKKLGF